MFTRPLFVGAHCDDVELFAGATVYKFRGMHSHFVVAFSRHASVALSPRSEMEKSMAILGIDRDWELHEMGACTGEFQERRSYIYDNLVRLRKQLNPSVVVTHTSTDVNQDHRQVFEEVVRVFYPHCSIVGGQFPKNCPSTTRYHMLVVISQTDLNMKCKALQCYTSQMVNDRVYFDDDYWRYIARSNMIHVKEGLAEAFEVTHLVVR